MFTKLLIANRGEIACRIIRTARRLGIATVAVHSEADANARHVVLADEAFLIGPAAPAESYLKIETILDVAARSGATAIHPGYGFLSENAAFAEACAAADVAFVGPPAGAIRAMGSKSEAKALMGRAGVPLVPGYHGADQNPERLAAAAQEIGYPVLIKASAGGGGKGMRLVERETDFAESLAGAQRESKAAFGDDRMLIEKFLTAPRHIELQVFADGHGNCIHLFERDCSLQRRHQKVVEEAPAPGLPEAQRVEMGAAAVAAAKAIDYRGAGTVEFICEGEDFYFMEMNTRLQVEHPVTEMITGVDLVEWQLMVAAGEPLPLTQDELALDGHAFEARLYAEDPARDFLPASGRLVYLRFPAEGAHVRIETGVRQGDEVSVHYDPMIAKLVVWDRDRGAALRRLAGVLAETRVAGPTTNLNLLRAIAAHDSFAAGAVDTGFIAEHRQDLVDASGPVPPEVIALAALGELAHRKAEGEARAARSADPYSPWNLTTGWRLNVPGLGRLTFHDGAEAVVVTVAYRGEAYELFVGERHFHAEGEMDADGRLAARLDDHRFAATLVRDGRVLTVLQDRASYELELRDPLDLGGAEEAGPARVLAPMPGRIVRVMTAPGATVERGTSLMVLEAMKMEHTVAAPADGEVAEVLFAEGDQVDEGAELVRFEAGEPEVEPGQGGRR